MTILNINPRVFVRKPYSVTAEGSVEFGSGTTPYAEIQHPTRDRAYVVIGSGITVLNIATRSAPSVVGTVTAAAGLIANQAIDGLAFDSTGRYLYGTNGSTSLYTFDLGAAFANEDNPTLVATTAISQGNNLHVLKRTGDGLYILAAVTNNSFQSVDISTPSSPSVSGTTAMTGHDIDALVGHFTPNSDVLLYPASDTSGKILAVPIPSPGSFVVLQLPTTGGLQIRCTAGIVMDPSEQYIAILAHFGNGGINHYFWMVYDIDRGFDTASASCTTETITSGAIASIQSPIIASSPKHVFFSGYNWTDDFDLTTLHLAVTIRDDSFGEVGELRFYAWGWVAQLERFARVPRQSGAVAIPNSYSLRARNQGALGTEWMCVGLSADRSNALLALATSDLLVLHDDYKANWFELTDVRMNPGIEMEYGIAGNGPEDRVATTGTLSFSLDNSEVNDASNLGGYSPDASSPITEHFQIGSAIVLTMNPSGFDELSFIGTVARIDPEPGRWEGRGVRVRCVDSFDILATTNVERLPLLSNISSADALKVLWDRLPYLFGIESLFVDTDTYVHEYIFDRAYDERTKVIGEIQKIMSASRGYFFYRYYGGYGPIHVSLEGYKREGLFFGGVAPILNDALFAEMSIDREIGDVRNHVTVRYYPRAVDSAATTVLATMADRVRIKPGETVVIDMAYRDPGGLASRVAGKDMVFPVVTTDYTMRSGKQGGGTDLDASAGVSAEFGATGARVSATNTGSVPGWFRTRLRGKGVFTQEPQDVTVRDVDSITRYQLRELVIDAPYASTETQARTIAQGYLQGHKDPRSSIRRVGFTLGSDAVTKAAASMGPTRRVGIQEQVSGLVGNDHWVLGTGKLGDTSGADASNLYGLDVFSVQRTKLEIGSQGITKATLSVIPEDMVFREPDWIDPKSWWDAEGMTKSALNLHLRDSMNSIFRLVKRQTDDVVKVDTTFADLTGLTVSIKAGEEWSFIAPLWFTTPTAADVKFTVLVTDVNGNTNAALASGIFGLVAEGVPIGNGFATTFGSAINFAVTSAAITGAILHGKIVAAADCTLKLQGAQNSASGTTTFHENSFIVAFRHKGVFGSHSGITGWTDPKTWAKGENVDDADLDTYLKGNLDFTKIAPARQTATITKTSDTALANLPGLSFSGLSGEVWAFIALSFTGGTAAADLKYTVTAPASSTGRFGIVGSAAPLTVGSETTFGNAITMTVNATRANAFIAGYITFGADGTVQIQGAQNSSDATPTDFFLDSPILAFRVSGDSEPGYAASQVLDGADLNANISDALRARRHEKAIQVQDIVKTSSAVFEDLTGLGFNVAPDESWVWFALEYLTSAAIPAAKVTAVAPPGTTGRHGIMHSETSGTASTPTFGDAVTVAITGAERQTLLHGGCARPTRRGAVQMQGAQNTSNASASTFYQDGFLVAARIP